MLSSDDLALHVDGASESGLESLLYGINGVRFRVARDDACLRESVDRVVLRVEVCSDREVIILATGVAGSVFRPLVVEELLSGGVETNPVFVHVGDNRWTEVRVAEVS